MPVSCHRVIGKRVGGAGDDERQVIGEMLRDTTAVAARMRLICAFYAHPPLQSPAAVLSQLDSDTAPAKAFDELVGTIDLDFRRATSSRR